MKVLTIMKVLLVPRQFVIAVLRTPEGPVNKHLWHVDKIHDIFINRWRMLISRDLSIAFLTGDSRPQALRFSCQRETEFLRSYGGEGSTFQLAVVDGMRPT